MSFGNLLPYWVETTAALLYQMELPIKEEDTRVHCPVSLLEIRAARVPAHRIEPTMASPAPVGAKNGKFPSVPQSIMDPERAQNATESKPGFAASGPLYPYPVKCT